MKFFYLLNRFASSRLTLGLALLVGLALLIWFGGPKLTIDESMPLASQTSRLIAICALATVFLLFEGLRRWRLERINRRILNDIGGAQSEVSSLSDRTGKVRQGFTLLCETLRERLGARRGSRRYLEQFSWYVVLGASGSGRSTALSNSGLEFPLETAFGPVSSLGSGSDFSQYCAWRVTDEAVFIDAPGAFVTQPGPEETGEWQDLLDCLKSARPRRPLNGVILTLPADLLIEETLAPEVPDRLRQCLQEMMIHFGAALPVYVLVTKCDRIAGFVDFFSNLDARERERPVGVTLPLVEQDTSRRGAVWKARPRKGDQPAASVRTLAAFTERYRDFTVRLTEWTLMRFPVERLSDSRLRIFAFPQQMQALGAPLEAALTRIFGPSRFRHDALLRGVYFCSACQEGSTIDMLMQAHQEAHALQPPGPYIHNPRREAAFFLKGVVQDVILPERNLVGVDPKLERRRLLRLGSAWVAAGIVGGTLCASWWLANDRAKQQVTSLSKALEEHDARQAVMSAQPDVGQAALAIAPLRRSLPAEIGRGAMSRATAGFGAYMLGSPVELAGRVETAYNLAATNLVRPAVLRDLGHDVTDLARSGSSTDQLRSLLALYISLSELSRFDSGDLSAWAAEHARGRYPLSSERQAAVSAVVGDAFDGLETPLTLDETVLAAARDRLYSVPPAEGLYARMKERTGILAEVSLETELGIPTASMFASIYPGEPLPSVRGYYSEPGFYEYFLPSAPRVIHTWRQNDWLVGSALPEASDERLFTALSTLYIRDYIQAWTGFLDQLTLRSVETPGQTLRLLESLLSSESPLNGLVRMVSAHTGLPIVRGAAVEDVSEPPPPGEAAAEDAEDDTMFAALGNMVQEGEQAIERQYTKWPGTSIRQAFAAYHALQNGKTGSLPGLTEIHAELGDLHSVIAAVANKSEPDAAAFNTVRQWMDNPNGTEVGGVRNAASSQPGPLRRMLFDLSDQSLSMLMTAARRHLEERWQRTVLEECQRAISGRYPIDRQSETLIAPDDFTLFFAHDGVINTFFEQDISPFVVTAGGQWEARSIYDQQIGFSTDALAAFRHANAIREAFDLNGAGLNELEFTISPAYLDNQAIRVTVQTENGMFSYRHEPPRRFRVKFAGETVEISITDKEGGIHVSRLNGPWAWFRMFDRFELQPTSIPDHFHLRVNIGGLEASFNIAMNSTVNPLAQSALTDFDCEESLL